MRKRCLMTMTFDLKNWIKCEEEPRFILLKNGGKVGYSCHSHKWVYQSDGYKIIKI